MPTYLANQLKLVWQARLLEKCSEHYHQDRHSILQWLLGEDLDRFDRLTINELAIANQYIDYRLRILRERYLKVEPISAYRRLINRLGSVTIGSSQLRSWVGLDRKRQLAMADVLERTIHQILHSDPYILKQIKWIARCTQDIRLREALSFATLEEYCLRPLGNQPLVYYHFVNCIYCDRHQHQEINKLLEEGKHLLPFKTIAEEQARLTWEKQQVQRYAVQQELESYLAKNVGKLAVRWLRLHLQGTSEKAIALALNLSVDRVQQLKKRVTDNARALWEGGQDGSI